MVTCPNTFFCKCAHERTHTRTYAHTQRPTHTLALVAYTLDTEGFAGILDRSKTHAPTHARTHPRTHACTHAHTHKHTYTHAHTYTHTHARNTHPKPQVSRTQLLGTSDPKMVTCPMTSFCTYAHERAHTRTRTYAHTQRPTHTLGLMAYTLDSGDLQNLGPQISNRLPHIHAHTHATRVRSHLDPHSFEGVC